MKILPCNSNRPLAEAISAYLNVPLTQASVRRFSDMEVFVEILENVRGEDVFVIQSTSYPANDNLMELLIMINACKYVADCGVLIVVTAYLTSCVFKVRFGCLVQEIESTTTSPIDLMKGTGFQKSRHSRRSRTVFN